jgi:IgA peptidase M64/peptidase M64-like protein
MVGATGRGRRYDDAMVLLPALAAVAFAAAPPRTFRVDYFHTGTATSETFALDRLVVEPLAWPGRPDRPIDDTNLGKYLFEVRDRATNRLLYSRGFASIYGEWETTAEARTAARTFSESLRFPAPAAPVQVILKKRGADQAFREAWTLLVDPRDQEVDAAAPSSPGPLLALHRSGSPEEKFDLLLVGDGYTAAQRDRFEADARRLVAALLSHEPWRGRQGDVNVWGLCPPSDQPGVSRPSTGQHRRSRVGASYDAFRSERYLLTLENRSLRDVASHAPYDALAILVNGETYGGGGIFNLYATVAAGSRWAPYVFVHELGHSVAALADEYFTSETAYLPTGDRPEPWEANVTADPAAAKWADLATPGLARPTPWPREAFTKRALELQAQRKAIRARNGPEREMDELFLLQQREESALLGPQRGQVGAFEGANYEAQGYFRPQADCVMFSRDEVPFCAVCQRTLSRVIDLYAGRPGR